MLKFDLRREKHAIGEFAAKVTFFQSISAVAFAGAVTIAKELAQKLNLPATINVQNITLPAADGLMISNQPSVGFQRFSEAGEPVISLQLTDDTIIFTLREYTGWSIVKPQIIDVFASLADAYLSEVPALKSVSVQYLNEFRGRSAEITDTSEVFATNSKWLAPFVHQAEDAWHCHIGKFIPEDAGSRYLININADSMMATFPGAVTPSPYSKVLILSALNFDLPGAPPLIIEPGTFSTVIDAKFEAVHKMEKSILGQVISKEYLEFMGAVI